MDKKRIITGILSIYIAFVFIQSLFFKFTGSPETDHIFGTLDQWAADSFGFEGLFLPPGIFNAYVIGGAELIASLILLGALFRKCNLGSAIGGAMASGIMTGAIFFHLFTPLGVEVQGDGGTLFIMACGVWLSGMILLIWNRGAVCKLISKSE